MATPFKHRLVGTIILVSLCVILLPDLLDGEKASQAVEGQAIPLVPPFPEQSLPELSLENVASMPGGDTATEPGAAGDDLLPAPLPEQGVELAVAGPGAAEATADDIKPQPKQPASKQTQQPELPVLTDNAWVVRLGAFRQKENALNLLSQLRQAGYKAFTEPAESRIVDGELTRVYVGPDLSKQSLEAQLPALARETGLSGTIAHYNPVKG